MSAVPFAIEAADIAAVARFLPATIARIDALRREQRHEAAARVADGLRRLAATIRAQAAVHGYLPEIAFGPELQAIAEL